MWGMFRLYLESIMGFNYLCEFWQQRFLVWKWVINVPKSFYHKDFLSIIATQEKKADNNIYVLIFRKFLCGKRRAIKAKAKRNIHCYCLSMFCKNLMLFKEAKGVTSKRFNSAIKTQVFLAFLGHQRWLQQSWTL
jgi:hypothetical protein